MNRTLAVVLGALGAGAVAVIAVATGLFSTTDVTEFTAEQQQLIAEHVYGGLPGTANLRVRNGYVLSYNPETRAPNWVAYHIVSDYRNTPERTGKWATFRQDPDIDNEAKDAEYVGLQASRGHVRGHLAPYGVMGGDRDGDGQYAADDDGLTVYQGNYMSNIAPQHHAAFNGSGGLWYKLERWVQDQLVTAQGREVWVFGGCIFGYGAPEKVGPDSDIWVPPMFYKVVITEQQGSQTPLVLAFLFSHQRSKHGDIQDFLVSVDVLEALTGLDFLSDLADGTETELEDKDTWEVWEAHFGSN